MSKDYTQKMIDLRGPKTQREVAEAVGVSTSTYSMYERGERTPSDAVKIKLASYFETTVSYLFFDEN